jgi:hypothetical protein
MRYSSLIFGIPDIVSEMEAPGLIIAHGYVGEKISKDAQLFISRDGGISWHKVFIATNLLSTIVCSLRLSC